MLPTRDNCCGCQACANACNKNAIEMVAGEDGFLYPKTDAEKCVHCGRCEKACPFLCGPAEAEPSAPKAYIVQNKDDTVLEQSASGGAFTAIAMKTIENGGVVFGASIDENYGVSHTFTDKQEDLKKFRGSKYVQSNIGDAYRKAESFLENGTEVCFSGTPCQINGLYRYLGKEYKNLFTVDLVCRGVPSPMVFHKYTEYQESRYPAMKKLVFRDKKRGYSYSNLAIYDGKGDCLYRGGSEYDPWLRLFMGGYCNRMTCYDCRYQNRERLSDFTVWDCWYAHSAAPQLDNNKGVSYLIARSAKAQQADLSHYLETVPVDYASVETALKRNPLAPKENRERFFSDCKELPAETFIEKYAPLSVKIKAKAAARDLLVKLHLHDAIRRLVHKMR